MARSLPLSTSVAPHSWCQPAATHALDRHHVLEGVLVPELQAGLVVRELPRPPRAVGLEVHPLPLGLAFDLSALVPDEQSVRRPNRLASVS